MSKVVWTIGLGIYVKTRNIWLVALFHRIIDLGALPFCFSLQSGYSKIAAGVIMLIFLYWDCRGYIC